MQAKRFDRLVSPELTRIELFIVAVALRRFICVFLCLRLAWNEKQALFPFKKRPNREEKLQEPLQSVRVQSAENEEGSFIPLQLHFQVLLRSKV